MSANPHDTKFMKWLRALEPRQELVVRCALRARYPEMRADHENTARIDELRDQMQLDEDRLAMILADASIIAKDIEKVIGETPPEGRPAC